MERMETLNPLSKIKRKRSSQGEEKNQRRFSNAQTKVLEKAFEAETRLEAKKKVEVARELGLQPRQVAIWFQNRRARWKAKQVEHDFLALRGEFDCLASKFEALKEEKQSLLSQLNKLNDRLRTARGGGNCEDGGWSCKIGAPKSETNKLSSQDKLEERDGVSNEADNLAQRGELDGLVATDTCQDVDASLASLESWCRLDQPRNCSQWLTFWG